MRNFLKPLLAAAAIALATQADAVPVFVNAPGAGSQTDYVLGMDFVVNNTVTITEMGVFDSNGDGFLASKPAGIWVGIYELDGPSSAGASGSIVVGSFMKFTFENPGVLEGGSRFKALPTALILPPGNYSIVASGFDLDMSGNTGLGGFTSFNDLGGALSLVPGGGRWNIGLAGVFPTDNYGGYAQSDPVFQAGTFKATVPDGGMSAILLGMGVLALGVARRMTK